ncbi:MAG: tRNA guanosine(34) transglycosylase Tgt [archaeon]|jgi:queuine tRNA-ribosyltransferase|nr:tRNA guanosine(34) transglycosylase Tgt [archaeon]MDD2477527.1 tRNA guanosine(34) transglycosylase Tgt [Candidatus ainarchaeum sp.]MDD3084826.1 tRNA guanosine(34) transglycosylase Tgt [Candidatus ainarchaeum sp.]MDD4221390.1 tRNA guanosine(34) transglycosylase Tgt [Candidatus ainarchaeum sp.]MDD4662370.1 tRNA guanosine(34) transglycosylase Tgt [Candidatus ainarchaeum sp.]
MSYKIIKKDLKTKARIGILETAHGTVKTPFFMPVVTKGIAKFITLNHLDEIKTQCFISNAYLLYLKPGEGLLKKTKGYHNFINWKKPIFTDSGGFQLKNKEFFISMTEKGVWFRSPYDGSKHFMSPERVMELQNIIGSDVGMVLDDMQDANLNRKDYEKAVENTISWAKRAIAVHKNKNQLIFGIVQGGTDRDLREKCAKEINKLPFDGIAIGGLALGESKENMHKAIDYSLENLDESKIKYLMGVGSPEDIILSISKGVDCFDSIYPTKMARHGHIFTRKGPINLKKAKYKVVFEPIERCCDCPTCKRHTLAYLHHLLRQDEPGVKILLSLHNIRFIHKLLEEAREEIEKGNFEEFSKNFLKEYKREKL